MQPPMKLTNCSNTSTMKISKELNLDYYIRDYARSHRYLRSRIKRLTSSTGKWRKGKNYDILSPLLPTLPLMAITIIYEFKRPILSKQRLFHCLVFTVGCLGFHFAPVALFQCLESLLESTFSLGSYLAPKKPAHS